MSTVSVWWVTARVSGIVAYLLLVASMTSGIVLKSRLVQRVATPVARMEWHRMLALLALALVGVHGVALVMDSYISITPADLLIPGGVDYRTWWVSAGVIATWLMLFVIVTAMMRADVGARWWKTIHYASYALFVAATAHGLMAGTDSGQLWMLALYIGATALVCGMALRRAIARPNSPRRRGAR